MRRRIREAEKNIRCVTGTAANVCIPVSYTHLGFGRECTDKELGGAIKGQGLCGMIGACIGGLPTDPYSQNVGLICTTKVVARRVFAMVGVKMCIRDRSCTARAAAPQV